MTDKERKRRYKKLWAYETANTKACSRCLKIKPTEEFSPFSNGRRSLHASCKSCSREYQRKKRCNIQTLKWFEFRDQEKKNKKICKTCLIFKPLSAFYSSLLGRKNVASVCKQCIRQHKYNITEEDYENLFAQQNNKCAICGSKDVAKFCIDHNHKTGKVRGLLCNSCNRGLGFFQDNPSLLRQAAKYLELV